MNALGNKMRIGVKVSPRLEGFHGKLEKSHNSWGEGVNVAL